MKKFKEFINESLQEIKEDDNTEFLRNTCKKCKFEQTAHFYMKEPIIIGKYKNYDLYINYVDINCYGDDHLAFWIIWNERPDKLYGTSWESSVIWEERSKLQYSGTVDKESVQLFPNFIEIIVDELKSYSDLDEWCKKLKEMGIKSRMYHRWAIQNSDSRMKGETPKKELTWEERLDWTRSRIEVDKLLNRYKRPYDQNTLDEMESLGEEKFNEKQEEMNKMMKEIMGEDFGERMKKKIEQKDKEENKRKRNG